MYFSTKFQKSFEWFIYFKWHSSCNITYLIACWLYFISSKFNVIFFLLEQLPHAYFICFIVILFGLTPVSCISSFAFFSIISLNSSLVYSSFFSCFLFSFSIVFCIHSDFCSIIFSISLLLILFGAFTITFPFFICM